MSIPSRRWVADDGILERSKFWSLLFRIHGKISKSRFGKFLKFFPFLAFRTFLPLLSRFFHFPDGGRPWCAVDGSSALLTTKHAFVWWCVCVCVCVSRRPLLRYVGSGTASCFFQGCKVVVAYQSTWDFHVFPNSQPFPTAKLILFRLFRTPRS